MAHGLHYYKGMMTKTNNKKGDKEMTTYAIMSFDDDEREETPIGCKTDRGARIKAKRYAADNDIKEYSIIYYRDEDGCRGWIDN